MDSPFFLYVLGFVSMVVIIILSFTIVIKSERIKKLEKTTKHLSESLDRIDEQAKLIVRTDLELNKIQEELDKKISGLYTLQRLSRNLSSTLDEKEIFSQIKSDHIEELGMQMALGLVWQAHNNRFICRLSIGYFQEDLDNIMREIDSKHDAYLKLIESGETFSMRSIDTKFISPEDIKTMFKAAAFCIAPIIPKEGVHGFLFVGTTSKNSPITEGDEELVTILANSIGQALENAHLFEVTWKAQQDLEKRVEQRTQELTEVVKELKRVSKRKTDFVSAVSHELRTPLTSIKGYASILLSKSLGDIPDPIQERLSKINRHSDELVHMINNLLDISRLESGKIAMKRQSCNLGELIDNILDLLSVQTKNKGIVLSANIPSAIKVMVDKSQIERVFINLVGNAIKFTPKSGKITVSAKPVKALVQVDVSDTGIGIPKQAQETIFEEFSRVDNEINERVKGTGLGLSLVKGIIEAHQGSIWVESRPGVGSTFSFLLPSEKGA